MAGAFKDGLLHTGKRALEGTAFCYLAAVGLHAAFGLHGLDPKAWAMAGLYIGSALGLAEAVTGRQYAATAIAGR